MNSSRNFRLWIGLVIYMGFAFFVIASAVRYSLIAETTPEYWYTLGLFAVFTLSVILTTSGYILYTEVKYNKK